MNNKQIILYYTCISIKYFRYSAALMIIALGTKYHLWVSCVYYIGLILTKVDF